MRYAICDTRYAIRDPHFMINFLHTYLPSRILISFGPIHVYWYGVFIVLGILVGIGIAIKLAEFHKLSKDEVIDIIFWLIIGGIIGARLYYILLEFPYFLKNPLDIFKIWQGGLAIHGALIAGVTILWYYTRRHKIDLWLMGAILVPALSIAQAIGRWGNYFNQENFGRPTDLPWGIPIATANRIAGFYNSQYFHPTFLYESLGDIIIFIILILLHIYYARRKQNGNKIIFLTYFLLYAALRFATEFLRIDITLLIFGWRLPQLLSLIIFLAAGALLLYFLNSSRVLEKK